MANRNNFVHNVLVTDDNSSILAKDNSVEDLTAGKIGFFDAETNVSFDNTTATADLPEKFYIAVLDGDGDPKFSAGQFIPRAELLNYSKQEYVEGSPMKVTISGFKPRIDTEYGIRVEFRNSEIYRIQGHVQFSKAYIVKTPALSDCGSTDECTDPNRLAIQLVNEINFDQDDLLVASLVASQDITAASVDGISSDISAGDAVTLEEAEALAVHNIANDASLTTSIELVPNTIDGGTFASGINLKFHKLLQTVIIVSKLEGLASSGATITETDPVFSQGRGPVVMQKEYHTAHYNGSSPYVISKTTNTPIGDFEYTADKNTNYTQYSLEYDLTSEGGFLSYKNPLGCIIAVPEGHSNTISSLDTLMWLITFF